MTMTGIKYQAGRDGKQIASLIRAAAKSAAALRGCRVSVSSQTTSTSLTIHVTLVAAPFDLADADYARNAEGRRASERYTPAARAALLALETIVASFNRRVNGEAEFFTRIGIDAQTWRAAQASALICPDIIAA